MYIDSSLQENEYECDKQRLSQILVNLLSNSLKFTFKGSIKMFVEEVQIVKPKASSSSQIRDKEQLA